MGLRGLRPGDIQSSLRQALDSFQKQLQHNTALRRPTSPGTQVPFLQEDLGIHPWAAQVACSGSSWPRSRGAQVSRSLEPPGFAWSRPEKACGGGSRVGLLDQKYRPWTALWIRES